MAIRKFKHFITTLRWSSFWITVATALIISLPLTAAILPEDRADILYHSYDGGKAEINGPSIMARKQIGQHFSLLGNYYIDSISSATIDVETFASPYTERREQYSLTGDLLYQNSTMSFSFTNSEESDYLADTYSFGISHNMFGDLTTVSLGFSKGSNEVWENLYTDTGTDNKHKVGRKYHGDVATWRYRLDLSQILTKNFIVALGYEAISDEGYLNNPYRSVALAHPEQIGIPDDTRTLQFRSENEDESPVFNNRYPETRTSNAFAVRAKYYLPWRAALNGEYRTFSDSWGIKSNMFEFGISQPIMKDWVFDLHYRNYSQTQASFYSNLFMEAQVYMARDKELSTFTTNTIGAAVSYDVLQKGWWIFDKGSINLSYDRIQLDYENFLDETKYKNSLGTVTVEEWNSSEPYNFSTDVIQFYFSMWY